ncbi:YfhO family protein [Armatimonas sp.]|uniref:YfhO family protein n=1 Tax=Armatimonas sp. TaxID=1872638 RepID=UPI00286B47F0|nr:YfhO family protein [Armatimonas sp.]
MNRLRLPQPLLSNALRAPGGGILLFFGTLALFFDVIFRGRVFFYGDLALYFLPELVFLRDELLAGRIPLWNPYVNCGQPFVGNPQTWPLYPSTLLLLLFSAPKAVALSTALHVLWASLGMQAFLRTRNLGTVAATLGAVAFAFGGAFVSKAQFPNMLQAMSWLPWLLWGIERLLAKNTRGRVAALGLFVGLALLAAHAQVTLMQLYLAVAWVIFRLVSIPRRERLGVFGALTLAALLGLGLALAQLLPVIEYAGTSTRPHLGLREANRFYLPWKELWLLVAPNAFGNPAFSGGWTGKGNFWEPCCYIGLIPLGLAFCGRGSRELKFWIGAALICFWLALGRWAGLFTLAFYVLPGVKQFHDPARWLYLGTFALAVLAAQGLERVRVKEPVKWGLVLLAIADTVFFARSLHPTCDPSELSGFAQAPPLTGRVFHLRPYEAWKYIAPYKHYSEVSLTKLFAQPTPNMLLGSHTRQAGGYEPVARREVTNALKALGELPEEPAKLTSTQQAQLEALGVERIVGIKSEHTLTQPAPLIQMAGERVVASRPGEWVLAPESSEPAEVIVRESFASGWRAWADGTPLSITSAPPIFMRVSVPPGTKRLVFRYEPLSWRVGVFLSGGAGCILVAFMMVSLRKRVWRS